MVVDVPPGTSCTIGLRFAPTLDPDERERDFWATLRVVAGEVEQSRSLHGRGVQFGTTTTEPEDPPPTDPPNPQEPRVALLLGIRGPGRVASSIGGLDSCTVACSRVLEAGTVVTLTAMPDEGSIFTGWTGCDTIKRSRCVVDMTEDRGITASFGPEPTGPVNYLTVHVQGTGTGSVSSSPAGIDSCRDACSHVFDTGTVVSLSAVPDVGSVFTGWHGCDTTDGSTCVIEIGEDRGVTATFDKEGPPGHFLTVQVSGTGTGSVSSSPDGIDTCRTALQPPVCRALGGDVDRGARRRFDIHRVGRVRHPQRVHLCR
jgi:hypothetical protein